MTPGNRLKWEKLFDNPLHTVIAETKLTEKFIEDEKGTDLLLPRMWVKEPLEVECRKFYALYCGYLSSRTHGKLSGTRVAHVARKSDKAT